MGLSVATAKLAIDEYNENEKKREYIDRMLAEYKDYIDSAQENAQEVAIGVGGLALITGDVEDAIAAYQTTSELAYHYYLWDNNFTDWVKNIDQPDFDFKFDKDIFTDKLTSIEDKIYEGHYDSIEQSMWDIAGSMYQYGQAGGFDWDEGVRTQDLGPFERGWYNIKDMFGARELNIPGEFDTELEWIKHIHDELKSGKNMDEILNKQQQYELGYFGDNSLYNSLFAGQSVNDPVDIGE